VTVTHIFVGLPVANYAVAYDWYVVLLGRPADMFPRDNEAVWRLAREARSTSYRTRGGPGTAW
jgi:hypothetical protein